ncbi:Mariner Mos1 transposase [Eumeta japonica]|uniref:Mariner Mos1 transposase n=1 Tax=Eumeta variegata TaxID=151549 RepID=A0A4C1XX83_EUMVA|nr:Mariner Mos1 transposase [Eumeta japonica]
MQCNESVSLNEVVSPLSVVFNKLYTLVDVTVGNFLRTCLVDMKPEAHRLLVEAHDEAALSERTYREWFQKFKNGDFDVGDKDRSGRPKIYDDAEWDELLEEDSSQTQKELALTLEVAQQAVSHRLKSLGIIHKQSN